MILYICRTKDCGFFRDMTAMAFSAHPEYFSDANMAQKVQYNTSVTHCPKGHGKMYQVQKGDRLAVIEDEKNEEAKELLKEWKELAWRAMPINRTGIDDLEKKRELDERTDRFLGKEGKNE